MSVQNYTNQYCSYIHEWDAVYEEYAKSVAVSYTHLDVYKRQVYNSVRGI